MTLIIILFLFFTVCTNGLLSIERINDCFTTPLSNFDGPQIVDGNATSFDWWYFDAVTKDGTSAVTIIFYRTGIEELDVSLDYVEVTLAFPNGSSFTETIAANSSNVTACGFGASGVWNAEVGSFVGTPDLSMYTILLNNSVIEGNMTICSTTPGHYPNGSPPGSNVSALAAPSIFWTNAIPGGIANGMFAYNGETLVIHDGVGYHDHNWGGSGLAVGLVSWYWGHAQVGDYTLVWFDSITSTNERHASTFLVKSGKIQVAGQNTPFASSANFSLVLPFGNETEYPPNIASSNLPSGFLLNFVGVNGRQWSFLAESIHIAENDVGLSLYTRWIGKVTGGEVGGEIGTGSGVWEWLRF